MADRTERYLYRCSSDKLMTHLGLIEECGDKVDWILDRGERGLWLICRKAVEPSRHDVINAVASTLGPGLTVTGVTVHSDQLAAANAKIAEIQADVRALRESVERANAKAVNAAAAAGHKLGVK